MNQLKRLRGPVLALVLWLALVACQSDPTYHGTLWPSPQDVTNFTLTSADGPVSLSDFRDEVVVLYFGYSYCPDICPGTMAALGRTVESLEADGQSVQVIMITVDPARDTAVHLADYVQHFHPSFIGLTGTEAEIAAVAEDFGVFYEAHEGTAATGYLVDHTARAFVIDKNGEYWLSFPFGLDETQMEADLRQVLRQG